MGKLSDYSRNKLLDHLLGGTAYTPAATLYLALCTDTPASSETGSTISEVSYTGYGRKAITFGAANLTGRNITQNAQVSFDQATAGDTTAVGWAICDADSAGNMLAYGTLDTSKQITTNNTPTVASGEVVITMTASGGIANYAVQKLLDLMFRNQAFTQPTIYCALTSAVIVDTDTGSTITELAGTDYARGAVATGDPASSGASANTAKIDFGTAGSGGWGDLDAACLVDATSAGNLLAYDNDNVVDQTISESDPVEFAAGAFDIAFAA